MLSVACLLNDTQLVEDLKALVSFVGYDMAARMEAAPLPQVYSAIRNMGIEVDLKTIATIYADVLPVDEEAFSSLKKIDEIVGRSFANILSAVTNLPPSEKNKQMGVLSIEESVVERLAYFFIIPHAKRFCFFE